MASLIDRLSALPDAILHHIVSFLPTKFSVATSILARRWRFLWKYVRTLDFDFRYHNCPLEPFSEIIYRVMLLHKVENLDTFRLSLNSFQLRDRYLRYQIDNWITTAIARYIKNIDLCLTTGAVLPPCLFNCKSLADLRLHRCLCESIDGTAAACLPSLKKLHLYSVFYESDEFLPYILSCSPVLEELVIDKILCNRSFCCRIFSPTIKKLKLNFQYVKDDDDEIEYRVEINAPSLRYLKLEDWISESISAEELTSLIEADIFLNWDMVEPCYDYAVSVFNFLCSLRNVKCLQLSSGLREKLIDSAFTHSRFNESTMRFDNLTRLEMAADWPFLEKFLQISDNLEIFIIREVDKRLHEWRVPDRVPTCLLSQLTSITIEQFQCTENEIEMVRYLLKNANALKRMKIHRQRGDTYSLAKLNAFQMISLSERGCKACKLLFC